MGLSGRRLARRLAIGDFGDDVSLQARVGGARSGLRQTQFAADNVDALSNGGGFEKGNVAIATLASKTAVAGKDQLLGSDVFEREADRVGDFLGLLDLEAAMADDADANLFLELAFEGSEQFDFAEIAVFGFDGSDIAAAALEIKLEGFLVAVVFDDALHVGIAPAGVDPKLDVVQALHLAVEGLEHEFDLLVLAPVGVGPKMEGRLLDLDALATGVAQGEQFLVHRHGHVPDDLAVVLVFAGVDVEKQAHYLRTTRAEA